MLVGDVRWARRCTGCSCRLSGGRKLSSAVTKVSKKAQVRRASARRSAVCAASSAACRRSSGWLIHQTMPGDTRSGQCVGAEGGKADHGDERERRRHPHAAGGVREVGRRGAAASARGVRRRLPLEQPALRQPQPPCGAGDRIEADERLVGQAGQRERGLAQAALRRRDDRGEMLGHAQVVGLARKVAEQTEQRRQEEHGEARERPQPRRLQDGPAEHEGERQRARRQTAPKVVQDLPARQTRQWIAHRDPAALHRVGRIGFAQAQPRQQPAGDLPIASHPAVAALHVGVVARRRLLDQFDVA